MKAFALTALLAFSSLFLNTALSDVAFGATERYLTAADGTNIRITFNKVYVPDSSYKPTNMYFAEDVRVTVQRLGLKANSKISVALMNFERFRTYPLTYIMEDIAAAAHPGDELAIYFEGNLKDAKLSTPDFYFSTFQRVPIRAEGYGGTFEYRQELAIVIDGVWLTDPISGTHNFKFSMY